MNRPILLWMTSRSRSSMIAAIFDKHGVYTGDNHVTLSSGGYVTYENQRLKSLQKQYWTPKLYRMPHEDSEWIPRFCNKVRQVLEGKGQWLMKTGVEHFHMYQPLNPINVFLRRPAQDVASSLCDKVPTTNYDVAYQVAYWRFELMDSLLNHYGGYNVNTDMVIHNEYKDLYPVFKAADITFNIEKTKNAITT